MKPTTGKILALTFGIVLAGCGNDNAPAVAQQPSRTNTNPNWSLKLENRCDTQNSDTCLARYGFTVTSEGKYLIGPTPDGKKTEGRVTADQLNAIQNALTQVVPAGQTPAQSCVNEDPASLSLEGFTLILTNERATSPQVLLDTATAGKVCIHSASLDAARSLQNAMLKVANESYDGLAFPSSCRDRIDTLEALYAQVKTCDTDANCAIVDANYNAIPAMNAWYNERVKPLTIANPSAAGARAQELTDADRRAHV